MDRTVHLQLLATPEQAAALTETVAQSTAVFNVICAYGWEHHIKNGVTLHHRTYRSLCSASPGDTIAMERLTGIRMRARQRMGRQNRRLHGWSFAQLKRFITYKAEERGCTVAEVNPRHTSQRCSRCGHTARTNR